MQVGTWGKLCFPYPELRLTLIDIPVISLLWQSFLVHPITKDEMKLFETFSFMLESQLHRLILLGLKALFPEPTKLLKPKRLSEVHQQVLPG